MNIEEIQGHVLLRTDNYRGRARELVQLIMALVEDNDLEPGMYKVDITRVGDEAKAVRSHHTVLALDR